MARAIVVLLCMIAATYAAYWLGWKDGSNHIVRQLFYGEKDFKQYLAYRRQQMEDSHEG